ncbi:hydrolase TatD [Bacteroidetes bacterium UKL13-3]|jgi:TatD DNase family protein|nr:hydrolase TatD [Bacteroidetes bacterium UKL13-3]HCP93821.1 hydrolase TatD [Bacteroidota bacterium]
MILTDTHAHLYANEFDADRKNIMQRTFQKHVTRIFLPNIDVNSIQPMLNLVWEYPENCFPMMGLHPCSVDQHVEAHLFQIQKWFKKRKFYAVGEIGLDFYWSVEFKEQQIMAFKKQIQWAIQQNLPINIHSRNATPECIAILTEMKHSLLRGIFHCFSGTAEEAKQITDLGFYLGIGGVLTFKNSGLDRAIDDVSLEHLVLETDAPYLAPVPYRGKRNESGYLLEVAQKLAELKNTTVEKVAMITTENSKRVFGI